MSEYLVKEHPQRLRFALVGGSRRTGAVASYLSRYNAVGDVEEHHFDLSQSFDSDLGWRFIETVCSKEIDGVALLGEPASNAKFDPKFANMLDERIVLLIKMLRDRLGPQVNILAEMHSLRNRSLFIAAGATNVVPVNLLAERFITRLAVGDKAICQTILSILEPGENCSLRTVTIDAGHPVVGLTLEQAFSTRFADGRVIGALPESRREELLNEQKDFGTHFKMCFDDDPLLELAEGDLLITICENDKVLRE